MFYDQVKKENERGLVWKRKTGNEGFGGQGRRMKRWERGVEGFSGQGRAAAPTICARGS